MSILMPGTPPFEGSLALIRGSKDRICTHFGSESKVGSSIFCAGRGRWGLQKNFTTTIFFRKWRWLWSYLESIKISTSLKNLTLQNLDLSDRPADRQFNVLIEYLGESKMTFRGLPCAPTRVLRFSHLCCSSPRGGAQWKWCAVSCFQHSRT